MLDITNMMANAPIPGESLTKAPKQHDPMFKPPKVPNTAEALEYIFSDLIDPDMVSSVLTAFYKGTTVESFVEMYLTALVKAGYISVDTMINCIEPTIFMCMAICKENGINPRLTRREPKLDPAKQYINKKKQQVLDTFLKNKAKDKAGKETKQLLKEPVNIPTGGFMGRQEETM